jgi:hypothetical protein
MARTAEVKRDARIGEAEAKRDAQIKEAMAEEERMASRYTVQHFIQNKDTRCIQNQIEKCE